MARLSRFSIARTDIIREFDSRSKTYYTASDLSRILDQHRASWRLTKSMQVEEFLQELVAKTPFKKILLPFPGRTYISYVYKDSSILGLAAQLSSKSYLSHYTALSLHGLTEQIPKRVYVTDEQAPKKPQASILTQQNIDAAFASPVRMSNSICAVEDSSIHLLKGKYTDSLGVMTMAVDGQDLRVTDLERTLIDIAVRPAYSGGIFEVLKAYERAREHISVNRLCALLTKLEFIYPYNQAIGFFMQHAGYRGSLYALLGTKKFTFDFYLVNEIQDKVYDPSWQIWYPKGFTS